MTDINVKLTVRTDKVGSDNSTLIPFEEEEWREMSEQDRQDVMMEYMWDLMDWGWEVVK